MSQLRIITTKIDVDIMKALMFGWEFPPHILGGLGTASYGLTKGLCKQQDMEVTFVIPKP